MKVAKEPFLVIRLHNKAVSEQELRWTQIMGEAVVHIFIWEDDACTACNPDSYVAD